jgi:hypothetical protein
MLSYLKVEGSNLAFKILLLERFALYSLLCALLDSSSKFWRQYCHLTLSGGLECEVAGIRTRNTRRERKSTFFRWIFAVEGATGKKAYRAISGVARFDGA